MSYYHSYPYGPSQSLSSGARFQGMNYPTPPYPAGAPITGTTPVGPGVAPAIPTPQAADTAIQDFLNSTSGRGAGNYIDHILNYNKGKVAHIHMTFNSGGASSETRVFVGHIQAAARDHIILSCPKTGNRYVLLMVYLDFVEFPEEINYYYPGTNNLNVVDEKFFEEHPEVLPLYNYQTARKEQFLQKLVAATPSITQMQPY